MVRTVAHLSEAELEAEYIACSDARRSRHHQQSCHAKTTAL